MAIIRTPLIISISSFSSVEFTTSRNVTSTGNIKLENDSTETSLLKAVKAETNIQAIKQRKRATPVLKTMVLRLCIARWVNKEANASVASDLGKISMKELSGIISQGFIKKVVKKKEAANIGCMKLIIIPIESSIDSKRANPNIEVKRAVSPRINGIKSQEDRSAGLFW
jgi:hypothetical protein